MPAGHRSAHVLTSVSSFPVSDIMKTLDAMSWVKVGLLYGPPLHVPYVCSDQFIPLARCGQPEFCTGGRRLVRSHITAQLLCSHNLLSCSPELSKAAAYTPQSVYTKSDVIDIVSYAGAVCLRFILRASMILNISLCHDIARHRCNCGGCLVTRPEWLFPWILLGN